MGQQSSVKILTGGRIFYIDPYQIPLASNDADYILLTHPHNDHMSLDDIEKVIKPSTILIATKDLKKWLE